MDNAVYIASLDAKDLYLSNHYYNNQPLGYQIRYANGELNLNKFINTLDYSLDLLKLRDVYTRVFRRSDFSITRNDKEYSQNVINVTFNYAVKEYNKVRSNIYVRNGWNLNEIDLSDNVYVKDGELIAIEVMSPVSNPIESSTLGKYFYFDNGVYNAKSNIDTVLSVADLRYELYENGFFCDGIKYVRWKRSAGSARVGKCLFIREALYKQMHKWDCCGIKVKENQKIDLAAWESYISLTTSSIIDTLEIDPKSILIIDDAHSVFKEVASATYNDVDGLHTSITETEVDNNIWDGQSLISNDIMGKYSRYGMVLLRQRFFKSCCFNCNIAQWFEDNNIVDVSQLNGYTMATDISQIKLITTPKSIKYVMFGSLQQWLDNIDSTFGVVKHDKPTHFFDGRMVMTHYQLINTLPLSFEEVGELLKPSFDYVSKLKLSPEVVRHHIKYPENVRWYPAESISRNDIVYKLIGINEKFSETKLYRDWLKDLTKSYIATLRRGKILVNGNYATLFGNPVEMLRQSIGKFDGTPYMKKGTISTKRFEYDKTLLASRSPHVAAGNIFISQNTQYDLIDKYFNLTNEIVCINSINENSLECLSGADFDSDTMLITDNEILLNAALRQKGVFPVPTRLVEAEKTIRHFTNSDKADLDIKTSVNKIGEIINLSQELNSRYWNKYLNGTPHEELTELYCDISQLDVMSNMAIDSAKKLLPVDLNLELSKLKSKYELRDDNGILIKPYFFEFLAKDKGFYIEGKKTYQQLDTPMDFIQVHVNNFKLPRYSSKSIPLSEVLVFDDFKPNKIWYPQVNLIIDFIREYNQLSKSIWTNNQYDSSEKYNLIRDAKVECIRKIDNMKISPDTMYKLVTLIEHDGCKDIRAVLMYILFCTHNYDFYRFIMKGRKEVGNLIEVPNGNIKLYDFKYVIAYPNVNVE